MNRSASERGDGRAADAFRSHWWHADHIALMAERLHLSQADRVLDLGCGAGQWAAALAPHLHDAACLVGIDRSAAAVAAVTAASDAMERQVLGVRGDARQLPFADASFDLVTAQTLLMHVRELPATIGETRRVLRPGGRVLFAEPLNRLYGVSTFAADRDVPVAEQARRLATQSLLEQAMREAGFGDLSVPEVLCQALEAAGFQRLQVHQSDRVHYLGRDAASDPAAQPLVESLRQLAVDGVLRDSFEPLLGACEPSRRTALADGLRAEQRRCARLVERLDAGEPLGLFPMHLFLVSAELAG